MLNIIIGVIVLLLWMIGSTFLNTASKTGGVEQTPITSHCDVINIQTYNNSLERLKILKKKMSVNKTLEKSFSRIYFNLNNDGLLENMYPSDPKKFQEYLTDETEKDGIAPITIDTSKIPVVSKPKPNTKARYNGLWVHLAEIKLHKYQYDLLKNKFTLDAGLDDYAYILGKLYLTLGSLTINMSVPPRLIRNGIDHELFGSPLNAVENYCSPMEIEKKFGSSGNFFDFEFQKDKIYMANPPFDETLMKEMALRLVQEDINCVVVIPVWDSETQKELGEKDYGMDFEAFRILKQHAKKHMVMPKKDCVYYSYYQDRLFPVVSTHVLLLGEWGGYDKFITDWKNMSSDVVKR